MCLSVSSLFVGNLACVYSKTGFRFRLQPPIAHEISSPETGFSRQCEDIYACECWDLFECVTTQEAEGCLSICRLLFFFFFFPTGVYFGMDVFLLSQSQEMSP